MRHLESFNPKCPSKELIEAFGNEVLPNSGYLNKSTRGKKLSELTLTQAEYIAYTLDNGSDKMKILAKMYFFCRLYKELKDEDMTEQEYDIFFNEEYGEYLKSNSKDDLDDIPDFG